MLISGCLTESVRRYVGERSDSMLYDIMRTVSGGVWWCRGVPLGALGNGFQVVLALKMTPCFPFSDLLQLLCHILFSSSAVCRLLAAPLLSTQVVCLFLFVAHRTNFILPHQL